MKKVSFLQFLFRIGDDYLMFLRNLTPAVLFLSLALFKMLWVESNSKQLIFFAVVNIVAVFMVLVYGTKYALNFYSSISTLND